METICPDCDHEESDGICNNCIEKQNEQSDDEDTEEEEEEEENTDCLHF